MLLPIFGAEINTNCAIIHSGHQSYDLWPVVRFSLVGRADFMPVLDLLSQKITISG